MRPQLQKNPKIMNEYFLHAITKPPHAITTQKNNLNLFLRIEIFLTHYHNSKQIPKKKNVGIVLHATTTQKRSKIIIIINNCNFLYATKICAQESTTLKKPKNFFFFLVHKLFFTSDYNLCKRDHNPKNNKNINLYFF